jgi:hypothetical protein
MSKLNVLRLVLNTIIGIVLCLISTLVYSEEAGAKFAGSSWVLPTVTIALFVVAVVAHVRTGAKN